ncbi:protoporphyrinogen oxidase [Oceanobacillus sp. E9]|uniref:Coproporphyrinogen III oxidase n=1 Tax=Oceanobacillus kimchii TaxID=746691 RepID=A0ABQ5TFH2_9BACI|nr:MULTISPECIES: protoporphyrinogen oxidase [Oceanobacillus]OEH54308.1 protoporphyrinogen oxidase [Oceanobacillus sp. E9]GLO65613.1 protoporphyrinogen oxidase [Oceanobacillus kimchii]
MTPNKKVVIVGGGITGLSAAYYLHKEKQEQEIPIDITLVEASDRVGGRIHTVKRDGFTIEKGPDSLLSRKPAAMELVESLNIKGKVVRNSTGQSYILVKNKLHKMPKGAYMGVPKEIKPLLNSKVITTRGKLRALMDLVMPKSKDTEDQSLGSFMRRRFGDELVDNQIDPLLSGIHSGDIDQMSLKAIYPIFEKMEQEYGSVMRGLQQTMPVSKKKKTSKQPSVGMFYSFEDGLQTLVEALSNHLNDIIKCNRAVDHIEKKEDGYHLLLNNGEVLFADVVIMTAPHTNVPEMLSKHEPMKQLNKIPATSTANVILAFDAKQIKRDLDGTGFLVTRNSDYRITACTWTHRKWANTTPDGKALLRCYVGKPDDQNIVDLTDEEITAIVLKDLNKVMKIKGEPLFHEVTRFKNARPQYHVGHLEIVHEVRHYVDHYLPGFILTGSSYDGTGIPDCIEHGKYSAHQASNLIK